MAVATKGGGVINEHFGHASEFLIYEASANGVRFIGHRKTIPYCEGGDTCGDGETALDRTLRELAGCEAVLCSKVGYEPWGPLEAAGMHAQRRARHGAHRGSGAAGVRRRWARPASWRPGRPPKPRELPEERRSMAFEIIETCVNCYACEPLCPNKAIYQASPHFLIDPDKCTECIGDFDGCPVRQHLSRSRAPSWTSWARP
jgi:ferredoxin